MLLFPSALITAAMVVAIPCTAQDGTSAKSPLSNADRDNIFKADFTVVKNTEAIPANVKQGFAEITQQPFFTMANPGREYQATDVVNRKRRLPSRRLIFAGRYGDKWFIHYERGGIGHYFAIILFSADGGKPRPQFLWGGVGFSGAQNLVELRTLVTAGRFSENAYY